VNNRLDLRSRFHRSAAAIALAGLFVLASGGCGALFTPGAAGTNVIAFATGELRSTEDVSLAELDGACKAAIERLAYEELDVSREADQVRFRARTASGEPVDVRLFARGPGRTELTIRIGLLGDETTSRLVLEEIHQSL
jgi:hypothetical protein